MGLLRPVSERTSARLQTRTVSVVMCPYNGHQVGWCRGLCAPVAGVGHCGRPAAHAMMGRTQLAIAAQLGRRLLDSE